MLRNQTPADILACGSLPLYKLRSEIEFGITNKSSVVVQKHIMSEDKYYKREYIIKLYARSNTINPYKTPTDIWSLIK